MSAMKKGSLTVEAVFVMSLFLLVLLYIIKSTITMCQEVETTAQINWLPIENAAYTFRIAEGMEE